MTDQKLISQRAKDIVRELIKTARRSSRLRYGTTHLIFSDCYFVSLTDAGVLGEVEELLRTGRQPLGFIAADRDRKRNPFIEAWERGDDAALAELGSLAHSIFWHLLPERNAQPVNAPERGE